MADVPCPVVVGRDADLGALRAALSTAAGGAGGLVFLTGEAGIGKSWLIREVASDARARDVAVVTGRAVSGGTSTPYRPLTEALLQALRDRSVPDDRDLAPWLPALGAIVPALSGGNHGDATPTVRDEATLRLLRRLARPGALVVVLEDLRWADPDTLAVIEYLGDNIWCEPLPRAGVLLTASGSASLERGALATAVDTLRRAVALRGHQASPRVVTTAGHRAVRGDGGSISVAAPAIQICAICTPPTAQGAGTELRWIGRSPAGVGGVGL